MRRLGLACAVVAALAAACSARHQEPAPADAGPRVERFVLPDGGTVEVTTTAAPGGWSRSYRVGAQEIRREAFLGATLVAATDLRPTGETERWYALDGGLRRERNSERAEPRTTTFLEYDHGVPDQRQTQTWLADGGVEVRIERARADGGWELTSVRTEGPQIR